MILMTLNQATRELGEFHNFMLLKNRGEKLIESEIQSLTYEFTNHC